MAGHSESAQESKEAMTEIRSIVANRLRREADRRNLSSLEIAALAGQAEQVVDGYLSGNRVIDFRETGAICAALSINPVRLFQQDYPTTRTLFRGATRDAARAAARVEEAFLTIRDILPRAKIPQVQRPDDQHPDISMLIGTLVPSIQSVRQKTPSVEQFLDTYQVPIIPIHASQQFDAFLLTCESSLAICINIDQAPVRVHFSLLHEIAHILYHRDQDLPVDTFSPNLYLEKIAPEARPEFIAYKFAQFFMLPFDKIERLAQRWPAFDAGTACDLVQSGRASVDVLANALFDMLRLQRRQLSYPQVRDNIKADMGACGAADMGGLLAFLERRQADLRSRISEQREMFSDGVYRRITEALQLV